LIRVGGPVVDGDAALAPGVWLLGSEGEALDLGPDLDALFERLRAGLAATDVDRARAPALGPAPGLRRWLLARRGPPHFLKRFAKSA
jgi:hypothetical protein